MTNHVHLLISAETADGCAKLMKGTAQIHTQYINRTYGRSGSLWEGRFRSCLVQTEAYVLACYRYIESNPVRAKLCEHPRCYPWSSYRANADGIRDTLVTPHAEYLRLADDDPKRLVAYRELFESPLSSARLDEIRKATNGNFALGDTAFRTDLRLLVGRRVTPGRAGRPARSEKADEDQVKML